MKEHLVYYIGVLAFIYVLVGIAFVILDMTQGAFG